MLNDLKVYEERIYSLENQIVEKDNKINDLSNQIKIMNVNMNTKDKYKNDYKIKNDHEQD